MGKLQMCIVEVLKRAESPISTRQLCVEIYGEAGKKNLNNVGKACHILEGYGQIRIAKRLPVSGNYWEWVK